MWKYFTGIIVAVLLILAGVFSYVLFTPGPGKPALQTQFLGFTNDTTGLRLATFSFSNAGPVTIEGSPFYYVMTNSGARWRPSYHKWINGRVSVLPSQVQVVSIVAPTNQPKWRAHFTAKKEIPPLREMAIELVRGAQQLGFPTRYRPTSYAFPVDVTEE